MQLIREIETQAKELQTMCEDLNKPFAGYFDDKYEQEREAREDYAFKHPEAYA